LALADTGTTSRGGDLVREWSTKRGHLQDDDDFCNNDNTEDWDTVAVTVVVVVVAVVELAVAVEEKPKRRQTRQATARIIIDAW
jgi:hypothetical protein